MVWRFRGLSLSGKILILKTSAPSKLLYACTMKVSSKFLIDQLNALQKKFIWDNKRPKIKHSTLIADCCEGGYKDVDTEKKIASLKIRWVTGLFDKNFRSWKIIPNLLFSDKIIVVISANYGEKLPLILQCLKRQDTEQYLVLE